MITIYESDAIDFATNGLGALSPESCLVSETLNGEYELTLVHPFDDYGKYRRIAEGRIIRAPVPAGKTPRMTIGGQAESRTEIYTVTTDGRRLYLRSGPAQDSRGIHAYRPGTEVAVIDKSDEKWYEVTTPDGKRGYMYAANLAYARTETTGTAAETSIREPVLLRDQPFRIYRVVPTLTGVTAYARHVFYDLMDNMVGDYAPSDTETGAQALSAMMAATLSPHDFKVFCDLDSTAEGVEVAFKNPAEAMLGDGGIAESYGGELTRDWWDIYLTKRAGEDTGYQIRYGKNLLGITYSEDYTNVITRIIPRGEDKDGNALYLPETYVDSGRTGDYHNVKWHVLDVKDAKEKTSGEDKRTKEECYELMRSAAQTAFDEGADLPTVTLSVSFIDCAETEEYAQYKNLTGIHMGDTVRVYAKMIGVDVAMRMTQYTYNCLTRRYESMTLGTVDAGIAGNMIDPKSIASGSIKGSMIARGGIGTAAIADGAITGGKVAMASIGYAHITQAAVNQMSVNALEAVRANIHELVAGQITADELYVDIAKIATAQITTANIINANIDWASITSLTSYVVNAVIANVTSLTAGELIIRGADGSFYRLDIDGGVISATEVQVSEQNIAQKAVGLAQLADEVGTGIDISSNTHLQLAVGAKLDKGANAAGLDTGDGGVRVLMTKDSFDVNVPGEAGDMHLDENGAAMNTINAQTVNSPSVTAVYTGPSELTVGTGDGELRTLQEAFSLLNDRFLTGNVTISCGADAYGAATLRGVSGSGQITIAGNGHTNYGSVNMERCKTGVYAENLNVVNSEGADQAVLMLECAFVQLHGCAINGGGAARALTMFYGVKAMVWDCGLYNAESLIYAGHCCDLSAIVMRGGTCTNFLQGDGCTARISGTRPDGALKTDNPCLFAPSDPAGVAIDYGSAQPAVPETASLTARAHETGTYYPIGHWFGSDSDMRQGLYDTTQYAGCMWFDLSALAGKTVKSASLTLTRVSGVGKSGAIELTIWVTRLSGKSGNALSGAGSYGAIGSIRNGETLTLGIPAAAVQELIDGTAGGLMLYAGDTALISGKKYSANYGKMSAEATLSVTYQ